MDRFQTQPKGGHYADTSHFGTSFKGPSSLHVPKKKEQVMRETEKGRPLWLAEMNKPVPASDTYDIKSTFGATSSILKTRAKPFLNMNTSLNHTQPEESALKKFAESP